MPKKEKEETAENGNEQNSGSDSGNDRGSADGSGRGGSDGSADGSGGNINGSGGSADGSDGSADGSDGSDGSGNAEHGNGASNEPIGSNSEIGSATNARPSRAERERSREPIRLGSFGSGVSESRADSTGTGSNAQDADGESFGDVFQQLDDSPIRLGDRTKRKPKEKVSTSAAPTVNKPSKTESKAMIGTTVEMIFDVIALTLKHDFWRLSSEEKKQLADALFQWFESMPENRSGKVFKFIEENFPVINLAMIAFFILSDRIRASVEIYNMQSNARKSVDKNRNAANGSDAQKPVNSVRDYFH